MTFGQIRKLVGDDQTVGARAYLMRAEGFSWGEIAEVFKAKERTLARHAKTRALKKGWPWPLLLPKPPSEPKEKEREAVQLRVKGKTWSEIGKALQATKSQAEFLANRYVNRLGLSPDRLVLPKPRKGRIILPKLSESQVANAFEMRIVQKLSWFAIAKKLGVARRGVREKVLAHTREQGLSAQGLTGHPRARDPEREKLAYELRTQGLVWPEVAKLAGYNFAPKACEGARWHAERMGLPWPVHPPGKSPKKRFWETRGTGWRLRQDPELFTASGPVLAERHGVSLNLIWNVRSKIRASASKSR